MTFEIIFSIITAVITAILGSLFKDTVVPARLIPLQNLIVGIVAAVVAISLNLFDNTVIAILTSLGMSFGVGGVYDLTKTQIIPKGDE